MLKEARELEYNSIFETYTSYEKMKPLVQKIDKSYHGPDNEMNGLIITWLENITDTVYVNFKGWYIVKPDGNIDQFFPTFESLAMNRSKMFNFQWAQRLFEEIKELEENDDQILNSQK